jgi:hypothetical protein
MLLKIIAASVLQKAAVMELMTSSTLKY